MADDLFPDLPPLLLERYRLRELPPAELARLDARLERDPALRDALARLDASDNEILGALAPEDFARRLEVRASARRRAEDAREAFEDRNARIAKTSGRFWKPALAGLGALALLALPAGLVFRNMAGQDTFAYVNEGGSREETVRIKGLEPRLAIYRKTAKGAEPVEPGAKARAGEFLRIGYQAGGYSHGAIVSVDGNGNVTRHWPEIGDKAARLEKGDALLPQAFELDAAPDYERFYFVVSKKPFELDPMLAALRQGDASLRDPADVKVVRFEILKDTGI